MKRIIFTVTNELNFDQRMHRICKTLSDAGYSVLLVGRMRPHARPLKDKPFETHRFRLRFNKGKAFYLEYNLRLFLFLLRQDFDIAGPVDFDTLPAAYMAARLRRKQIVFDAHEYFPELPEVIHRPLTRRIWNLVGQWLVPGVDQAYTVNASLARILNIAYGHPFSIIRNLPEPLSQPLPEKPSQREKILLYQGVLNRGRGLEELIAALPRLPECRLWLAGEGDLSEKLRTLTRDLGLEERVRFFGYLEPGDLRELTRRAWIGLNLLEHEGMNYYYSLANKTFDYIQAELPAIAMAYPEYTALNRKHKVQILVEDLNADNLINAIRQLTRDPQLYDQIVQNCRNAARELHWQNEAPRLLQIFNKLNGNGTTGILPGARL